LCLERDGLIGRKDNFEQLTPDSQLPRKEPEEGLGTQRREEEAWCLKNDLS